MIQSVTYFFLGAVLMWFASGFLIDTVEKLSRRVHISRFLTSFLVLGVLTSLTEISVGFNAVLSGSPSIFVGNLVGGSFVIILFIIPFLSLTNRGIRLNGSLTTRELSIFLILVISPALLAIDGHVSLYDAFLALLLYGFFLYQFQRSEQVVEHFKEAPGSWNTTLKDLGSLIFGAILIYIASRLLVFGTLSLAESLQVSAFLVSLFILSLGTNFPEMVVAIRAIARRQTDIAFGDYIGSASFNPLIFSALSFINGPFLLDISGFRVILFVMLFGYALFFVFARSKETLSPLEGLALIFIFITYILLEISEIVSFSPVV